MNDSVHNAPQDAASAPAPQPAPAASPRRSLPRRIVRIMVRIGAAAVLFNLALLLFTETSWFRSIARDALVSAVDSSLYAHLEIGEITGNIFSGWEIHDVRLTTSSGPLVTVRSVVVGYSLFTIPWKKIDVREVTLNEPVITLTRAAGRGWNYENLVRDTTESKGGKFDWRVLVRSLRIVDGHVIMRDSTVAGLFPQNRFTFDNVDLRNLEVALTADIGPHDKRIAINQLSFNNHAGEVSLISLSGDIRTTDTFTEIHDLSLLTDRSRLLLNMRVDSMNLVEKFTYAGFTTRPVSLSLTAPVVDMRDLQYFLPSLDFLGGTASLDLAADGSMKKLHLTELDLNTSQSRISFAGTLRDIDAGADLIIDVSSSDTRIDANDLPIVLPGIPLPDYREVGTARFSDLSFKGRPLMFTARIDAETDAGAVKGEARLDITGPRLVYDGSVSTRGLDLAHIFREPALSSSLTLRCDVKGAGFTPGEMTADVQLRVDSSRYQRYTARALTADITIRPDSLAAIVRGDLVQSTLALDTRMSFAHDSVTGFTLDARAQALDLGRVLGDDSLRSNLDVAIQARGDGIDPRTASGDATIVFGKSTIQSMNIGPDTLSITLAQHNPSDRLLSLQSQYADISVAGRFDLPRFAALASEQIDSIQAGLRSFLFLSGGSAPVAPQAAASRHANAPAGGRAALGTRAVTMSSKQARHTMPFDTSAFMDARYDIVLRSPERFARFFSGSTAFFKGEYQGTIRGGWNALDLEGTVDLTDAYYVSKTRSYGSAGLKCTYRISDLSPRATFDRVRANLDLRVGDASWGDFRVRNTGLRLQMADRVPHVVLRGTAMDKFYADIDVQAATTPQNYSLTFNKLDMRYIDQVWKAETPARVVIDTGGIGIPGLRIRRNSTLVRLSGTRAFAGRNDFHVKVDSLHVGDLEYLLTENAQSLFEQGFTGVASVDVDVRGTDAAPIMALDAFVSDLGYQGAELGALTLEATYSDARVELYSELENRISASEKRKVFFASGSLPVFIAFNGDEGSPSGSANLRVQMKKFPLAMVERLVSVFSPLEGYADADISLSGKVEDANLGGYLEVKDATGRLASNNMSYLIDLRLEPQGSTIHVKDFTLRNLPSERNPGTMHAGGTIEINRYRIGDIDLLMNGQLKVLRKASRSVFKIVYGDLYVATGPGGIRYSGRLDRSNLRGNLQIADGNLIFPSDAQNSGGNVRNITYVDIDDVAMQRTTSFSAARERVRSSVFGSRNGNSKDTAKAANTPTILDAMNYSLNVSTVGSLVISMPLSALSQQELNAKLEISDFTAVRTGPVQKFTGEVLLGSGSRYIFLGKPFRTTGKLTFLNDLQNPDLDLKAVYTEYHTPLSGSGEERRRVYVILTITGSRMTPRLSWDLRFDSETGTQRPRGGNLDSDALSFILFGLFSDELSASEKGRGRVIDNADAIANALGSSYLSSYMTDLLSRSGLQDVLKRIEVDRLGSQDTRLKLTGEIGQAILTYDAKINNLSSSEFVLEFPLGALLPSFGFGNMVVQFSLRNTNSSVAGGTSNQESSVYEGKVLYRFSF